MLASPGDLPSGKFVSSDATADPGAAIFLECPATVSRNLIKLKVIDRAQASEPRYGEGWRELEAPY